MEACGLTVGARLFGLEWVRERIYLGVLRELRATVFEVKRFYPIERLF
jgi:hypothetical protein